MMMEKVSREKWETLRTARSVETLFAAELCHRVANEFGAVSAALHVARRKVGRRSAQTLTEAADRVDAFVALHRLLIAPIADATIDLPSQLEQICLCVADTRLAPRGISLTLRADACTADARTGWILSLLLAETLTNVAKHAFPTGPSGGVVVSLDVDDRTVTLSVGDDGHAFSTGEAARGASCEGGTAGHGIVSELAQSVGGTFARVSTAAGTLVEIVVPVGTHWRARKPAAT